MPRYRRISFFVDAEQFTHPAVAPRGVYVGENGEAWVETASGHKTAVVPGDWIVAESDGKHFYSCNNEMFTRLYEKCG
jgi:quercetin dioxygenase-like cupin family protein